MFKEIEAAMQVSMRNALGMMTNKPIDGLMDDLIIMKEILRVKDEELQNLARELRKRDSTIKDIAEKISETAEAAEAAASSARTMNEQRRIACAEIQHLTQNYEKLLESSKTKLKDSEDKVVSLTRERDQQTNQRDSSLQEAQLWCSELAKAGERAVVLEAAVVRAEEKVKVTEADAEALIKNTEQKEFASMKDKQELLAHVNVLQAQLRRHDKHISEDRANNPQPVQDSEWSDIQATEARRADVREVDPPQAEAGSLDISVVNDTQEQGVASYHHQC